MPNTIPKLSIRLHQSTSQQISHLKHSQSNRSPYGETMASRSDFTYDDSVAEDELTVVQETGRRRYEYVHHP